MQNKAINCLTNMVVRLTLEPDRADDGGVGRDDIDGLLLSEVPDAHCVVGRTGDGMVSIGCDIHAQHLFEVALKKHDASTSPEVPDTSIAI